MPNSIVVPLDGSQLAERALAPAQALARHLHAELLLVRVAAPQQMLVPVHEGFGVLYPDQSLAEARQEAERYFARLKSEYADDELPLQSQVVEGDVAGSLVDAARQAQSQLIIMSSHGYSGVRRWLLGSVAEKVLHAAPCPVWVVRLPATPRHVLVPLDGSLLAEEVLVPAMSVARCFGARVSLLRVLPAISAAEIRSMDAYEPGLGLRYVDEAYAAAQRYLGVVAGRCAGEKVTINSEIRSGLAADAILEFAEHNAVDLVAMTTHGRSGLRRWAYGSVTNKVLSHLPVSMLIARPSPASLS